MTFRYLSRWPELEPDLARAAVLDSRDRDLEDYLDALGGGGGLPSQTLVTLEASWGSTDAWDYDEINWFGFMVDSSGRVRNETDHVGKFHAQTPCGSLQYHLPEFDFYSYSIPAGEYWALGFDNFPYMGDGVGWVADGADRNPDAVMRVNLLTIPTAITRIYFAVHLNTANSYATELGETLGLRFRVVEYPSESALRAVRDLTTDAAGHEWAVVGYLRRSAGGWSWVDDLTFPVDQAAVETQFGMPYPLDGLTGLGL